MVRGSADRLTFALPPSPAREPATRLATGDSHPEMTEAEARRDTPRSDAPPVEIDHRTRLEILGAILLGLFLAALDQTIVGTALPRIVDDLRGNDLYTWVFTVYLLTSTVTGPIYGKLSDLFGRRPIIMIGIGLFLGGSALSGLSSDMWQLILFRGIQGLGAGSLFPVALAVIGDLFSPSERGKYQGLFGAVFGISALVGPALGGLITDTVGWPWVFFVNLPIGAISLFIIWRTLPSVRRPDAKSSIDYLGASVFVVAIVPILIGLTNKQFGEWTDPAVGGLIALGLLISALFVWIESLVREPIVPLGLFRNRTFTVSVVASFLASFGFFATIVFLPRWFQVVRGASATESGYQTLPLLAGLIASSIIAGQLTSRTGRYKTLMFGSLALLTVGLFTLSSLRADTPAPLLWVWMFVTGLGIGPSFAILTLVVQNAVPFSALGAATSNLTFFRQVGGTVGLAIAGTIFGTTLRDQLPVQLVAHGIPQQFVDRFGSSGFQTDDIATVGDLGQTILAAVPEQFRGLVEPIVPNIVAAVYDAFSIATAQTFIVGVGSAALAALACLFLRELPLRTTVREMPAGETSARPAELAAP